VSGTATEDVFVADLARATVERAAPAELPLFGPTSDAFFDDPAALERDGGGDRMLGFGVDAAMVLLTPAALTVAKEVFGFISAQVRARLKDEGEGAVQGTLDRIFGRRTATAPEEPKPPELSDEQLERVRALALEKAKQLKLAPDKAELLADSLVGSLATE
jgi:hypothetical protein